MIRNSTIVNDCIRRRWWALTKNLVFTLIGGIFSLTIAMGIGRFSYTPLLPFMQDDFGFSDAVAGLLATSNYAGYLVGALVASIMPTKEKRALWLKVSLVSSVITTGLMGLTHTYVIWHMLRFLSGVASSFVFVFASSIVLDKLARKGKTSWSGFFYSGVGIGIFTSSLLISYFNQFVQWEMLWIGLAALCGILTLFGFLWVRDKKIIRQPVEKRTTLNFSSKKESKRFLTFLLIAYGLEGLGYIVTGTFIVSIAEKTATFNKQATAIWMIVGLAAIPSCFLWAKFAKIIGAVQALITAMVLQAVGITLPVIWNTEGSFLLSAILFGATFMGITTLATTLAREIDSENSSRIIGTMTAMYATGQMIGPVIAGSFATITGSFHLPLLGAGVSVLIGAFLLVLSRKNIKSANERRYHY